ncbi:MAG: right-handed parallel beta-helix repeat-containing protein [Planctomycetes bacterium]|nr:right-handed parallel beta-helix repeat-containing protein [Planctomycetota bacterium]
MLTKKSLLCVCMMLGLLGSSAGADDLWSGSEPAHDYGGGPANAYCGVAGTSALAFDGVDDLVNLGNHPSLRITGNISVSAWVKLDEGTAGRFMGIVGKLNFARGYALVRDHNNRFAFITANGFSEASYPSTSAYTDSEWHHVAGVLENGHNTLFVDGLQRSQGGAGLTLADSGQFAYVGRQYSGWSSRYFAGLIDDVRVYNRALNPVEMLAVMSVRANPGDPGIVGYWPFDEGQGQIAADASGYGNTGYLGQDQFSVDAADPTWTDTGVFCQTARTYYVSALVGSNSSDGLSPQRPFRTIQHGIDMATDGDTVLVAAGIYRGLGNKDLDYGGRSITVRSEAGSSKTIIDCQGSGRGAFFHSGETTASLLDGFTIINGNTERGAGIYCLGSSPTIQNCVISGCSGFYCAGIYCKDEAHAIISNCKIVGNAGNYNGGVRIIRSNTQLINCLIADNASSLDGAGVRCDYGPGSPVIRNCTVTQNSTGGNGGGVWAGFGSQLEITNSILWGNTALGNGNNIAVSSQTTISIDYCDIQGGQGGAYRAGDGYFTFGPGILTVDPLFPNSAQGNYTLQSQAGRYDPIQKTFVNDPVTSPCIDAGDPASDFSQEESPNGSRINMGAYGGTPFASKSGGGGGAPCIIAGDFNNDGVINITDLFVLIDTWLELYGPFLSVAP